MAFKFEKLLVWQESVKISAEVSELVQGWPKSEMFVLTSQIQRAIDSVALNISEGSTGQSNKEFRRFLGMALRSGIEVVTCLYLAKSRGLISEEQFHSFYEKLSELVIKIQALRNAIRD
ncbi:MAG: four helix bundle protein [Cytophagales bacterium]|nr:four helix bundle protein [Cytophagales bacterium]